MRNARNPRRKEQGEKEERSSAEGGELTDEEE
jgi:hypothetical protein